MIALSRLARGTVVAVLLLLAMTPAAAQRLGQGTGAEVPIWRVLGALVLCLALAVAGAYFLRRRMGGAAAPRFFVAGERRLQLVETMRLSHQVDLCLVRCDDRELLLVATPHGARLIDGMLSPPPPSGDQEKVA